jgi:hypothetical protein
MQRGAPRARTETPVAVVQAEEILDAIISRPQMFRILFAAPAEKLATDSAMSSFFAKAVAYLMSQRGHALISWLEVGLRLPIGPVYRL